MRIKLILLVVLLVSTCVGIAAQQGKPAQAPAASDKKQQEEATIKADKSKWTGKNDVWLLTGNITITYGDTVLSSAKIVFDRATNVATSEGKIRITNPDCDITGNRGVAYLNKRLGVVEGDVVMQMKPKPNEADADKESVKTKFNQPTTITCSKLEYKLKAKIANATGSVNFKQHKRTASSDKAVYDLKKELLELTGNVKGKDEDGQTFTSPDTVTISLKKGDEWMEAPNATATFKVNLKDEEDTK